ncbi:MAG TPA: pilin [Candidatus Paceibacterota bacterium]
MYRTKFAVKIAAVATTGFAMLPLLASAQAVGGNIPALLSLIESVVGRLIPIFVALALIYFIWGLMKFILAADSEAREEGKKGMWWGIVALFVIVSIWGIVAFISRTLGIDSTTNVNPPTVGKLGP